MSTIYRNFTAILPQFFSDASIQKFHFSPEEKSFSLGTLYVYVFTSVLHVAFLFLSSQNVVHFWTVIPARVKGQ